MPTPSTNGQPPDDPRPQNPRERSNGLIDLFAETEALRTLLSDALSRTSRLLAGLRHHKRQAHAVQAAILTSILPRHVPSIYFDRGDVKFRSCRLR